MTITCFRRYKIDQFGKATCEEYASNWGQEIPLCGADLIGELVPNEKLTMMALVSSISRTWPLTSPLGRGGKQVIWA